MHPCSLPLNAQKAKPNYIKGIAHKRQELFALSLLTLLMAIY